MLHFSVPVGRSGITMQRCIEAAINGMKDEIDAHQEGARIYPEDIEGCEKQVISLWNEIKSLRNLASFSLSNAIELGLEYELTSEDPLMVVSRNAVLLEFIDHELGEDTRSSITQIMNYIFLNPILDHLPDDGTRIYH